MKKSTKIVGGIGVVVVLAGIGSVSGGSDAGENAVDEPSAAPASLSDQPATEARQQTPSTAAAKPETKPAVWKTVDELAGSSNKAGPNFHLHGCETRLSYTMGHGQFPMLAVYVMEDGTSLDSDGGFPEVMVDTPGSDTTILRKDEGDYYLDVNAANADWTVKVEERC